MIDTLCRNDLDLDVLIGEAGAIFMAGALLTFGEVADFLPSPYVFTLRQSVEPKACASDPWRGYWAFK
ncbi:hypothetical protein J2Z31_005472 [Sinorhizobium kostiense]|uniref:Uncharacterized protein n=1 Tax=Sinorhizobium kostiense TaxID=76747 RepID=A0ABS4R971_9HYPH|nr:hypothetical protein [Sinorhizobium kostiense]MBP2238931.1 hypothetical protein [Sinorhizobium kostiense]